MRELHRARHAEFGEPPQILRGEQLGVLDALAQPLRLPDVARLLERVERFTVGAVADRVHGDGEAGAPRRAG